MTETPSDPKAYTEPREAANPEHRDAGQVAYDEQREKNAQAERERQERERQQAEQAKKA